MQSRIPDNVVGDGTNPQLSSRTAPVAVIGDVELVKVFGPAITREKKVVLAVHYVPVEPVRSSRVRNSPGPLALSANRPPPIHRGVEASAALPDGRWLWEVVAGSYVRPGAEGAGACVEKNAALIVPRGVGRAEMLGELEVVRCRPPAQGKETKNA